MLYTNLKHLENSLEHAKVIRENEQVVVICGRMAYQCIPAFRMMEELESSYEHLAFYDMEFDNPESEVIRSIPEVSNPTAIPMIVCYKQGKVVSAVSGIHTKDEIIGILNREFTHPVKVV